MTLWRRGDVGFDRRPFDGRACNADGSSDVADRRRPQKVKKVVSGEVLGSQFALRPLNVEASRDELRVAIFVTSLANLDRFIARRPIRPEILILNKCVG